MCYLSQSLNLMPFLFVVLLRGNGFWTHIFYLWSFFFLLFFSLYHINQCKISALILFLNFLSPPFQSLCWVLLKCTKKKKTSIITLKSVRDLTTLELFSILTFQKFYLTWLMTFHCLLFYFFFGCDKGIPGALIKGDSYNTTSFTCCVQHILKLINCFQSCKDSVCQFYFTGSDF